MIKRQLKKTYPIKHQPNIPTTKPSIPFKIILEDRVINRDGSVTFLVVKVGTLESFYFQTFFLPKSKTSSPIFFPVIQIPVIVLLLSK